MSLIKRLLWSLIPIEIPADEEALRAEILALWADVYGETA